MSVGICEFWTSAPECSRGTHYSLAPRVDVHLGDVNVSYTYSAAGFREDCNIGEYFALPMIDTPANGLLVLRSVRARVLLPDPVRPTTATVDRPGMRKDTSEREGSRCGAYLMVTFSKTISSPYVGHAAGGSKLPTGSSSKCKSSTTRSTETKSICNLPYCLQSECVNNTTEEHCQLALGTQRVMKRTVGCRCQHESCQTRSKVFIDGK